VTLRAAVRPALTAVWLICSVALGAAIIAPFVAPAEVLYGVFPECEAKRRGSLCALCGMTTAFVLIARGDIAGAQSSNSGSVALWSVSAVNFAGAAAYSTRALRKRR
jgi:hypothetical protein